MSQRSVAPDMSRLVHLDTAMDAMESELSRLSPWDGRDPEGGRSTAWLGDTSVRFCRQVLDALDWYPEVLPDNLDAEDVRRIMEAELVAIERLVRRRDRLRHMAAHADSAVQATGGGLMETVMEVYSLLARANRASAITSLPRRDGGKN